MKEEQKVYINLNWVVHVEMEQYKRHFLTNVILNIEFAGDIELNDTLNADVQNLCVQNFPIKEAGKQFTTEFKIGPLNDENNNHQTKIGQNNYSINEWKFFGENREKRIKINKRSFSANYFKYQDFGSFKSEVLAVVEKLKESYPGMVINKISLRYIDQINFNPDKNKIVNWYKYWGKYINKDLVAGLRFCDNNDAIARHMSVVEMNYGEFKLRFQYGIFNEDFPAANKKRVFIIDTNSYAIGSYEIAELRILLDDFHVKSVEWFEKSITNNLREKMGVDYNE